MKRYEIRLERAEVDETAAVIELGLWSDGCRQHTAVVEVAQAAGSPSRRPPTLERDPERFWSSAVQVAAEMLKAELMSNRCNPSDHIRPDSRIVEHWAQWERSVPTVSAGGVVRAWDLPNE